MTKDEIAAFVIPAVQEQAGMHVPPVLTDTLDDLVLDSLDVATIEITIDDRFTDWGLPPFKWPEGFWDRMESVTVDELVDIVAKAAGVK